MKQKWILLVALVLTQIGDLLSTRAAIAAGAHESNPIGAWLGLPTAKLVGIVIIALLVWRSRRPAKLWALVGFYALVVAWNLSLAHSSVH